VAQKMYTLFTHQYVWNKLWQCLDANGGHFEQLQWIQNSRTSLISILLLYKYSSYDYRVIFFTSKCVYIILGHSVYWFRTSILVKEKQVGFGGQENKAQTRLIPLLIATWYTMFINYIILSSATYFERQLPIFRRSMM
jgi:hypothetical protein